MPFRVTRDALVVPIMMPPAMPEDMTITTAPSFMTLFAVLPSPFSLRMAAMSKRQRECRRPVTGDLVDRWIIHRPIPVYDYNAPIFTVQTIPNIIPHELLRGITAFQIDNLPRTIGLQTGSAISFLALATHPDCFGIFTAIRATGLRGLCLKQGGYHHSQHNTGP